VVDEATMNGRVQTEDVEGLMKIDSKGFIVALENLSPEGKPAPLGAKDERITRLAVSRSAVQFSAARPECKSSDVLAIAERWLAWVNQ
jgi:hypothetical protein